MDLYGALCSYDNLFLAYKKARKRKTKKSYVLEFEKNLKENLLLLRSELLLHRYSPKPLVNFTIHDPKTRKISKSEFRDRVLHHALCNIIKTEDETFAQKIILGEENNQSFTDFINEAKEEYKRRIVEGLPEQRETEHIVWNVPKLITYNSKYKESYHKKSIMKPYFASTEIIPEKDFIKILLV